MPELLDDDQKPRWIATNQLATETGAAWSQSFLSREACKRVVDRVGVSLARRDHLEVALLVLADITAELAYQLLDRPPFQNDNTELVAAYTAFKNAHILRSTLDAPPPLLPRSWCNAFEKWIISERRRAPRPVGRPKNLSQREAYIFLLDYYWVAFGRKPAATNNPDPGPAIRFILAHANEVELTLAATIIVDSENRDREPGKWPIASASTTTSVADRIRELRGELFRRIAPPDHSGEIASRENAPEIYRRSPPVFSFNDLRSPNYVGSNAEHLFHMRIAHFR
ncbi:MAG: hypothetical protein ABIO39_11725 [Caulobacteraceae bacterium]